MQTLLYLEDTSQTTKQTPLNYRRTVLVSADRVSVPLDRKQSWVRWWCERFGTHVAIIR
jgi:hypothetical protein